ncbi:MAG: hypothetical protein NTX86_03940 [Candidatus Dependentiae bacterium]|nr:hypothetical protein [Candidatus Dependentiae bacterium]
MKTKKFITLALATIITVVFLNNTLEAAKNNNAYSKDQYNGFDRNTDTDRKKTKIKKRRTRKSAPTSRANVVSPDTERNSYGLTSQSAGRGTEMVGRD